jgi:hypothetical protein
VASLVAGKLGLEPITRADVARCRTLLDEYPAIGGSGGSNGRVRRSAALFAASGFTTRTE